jgi:hypothetical protein
VDFTYTRIHMIHTLVGAVDGWAVGVICAGVRGWWVAKSQDGADGGLRTLQWYWS